MRDQIEKEHRKKIMVIDDDSDISDLVELILITKGFNVHLHPNGSNVQEIVTSYNPDLILLDIQLGDESGIEICKQLKTYCNIPVILFSAQVNEIPAVTESGADALLEKPFEINRLVDTIEHHLNKE